MRCKLETLDGMLVGYVFLHVPFYLAVDYFVAGSGLVWQVANLVLLLLFVFPLLLSGTVPLIGWVQLLLGWVVFALSAHAMVGLPLSGPDISHLAKIVLAMAALCAGWKVGRRSPAVWCRIPGFAWAAVALGILSQLVGMALGVTTADRTYEFAAVGVTNSVAAFSAFSCTMVAAGMAQVRGGIQLLLATLVGFAHIGMTMRRTAWLSLVAQTAAIVLAGGRRKGNSLAWLFGGVLLLLVIILLAPTVMKASLVGMIAPRIADLKEVGSLGSGRAEFYRIALDELNACGPFSCVFGSGTEGTIGMMWSRFGAEIGAHSWPLDFGLAFGWPALVLSSAILGAALLLARNTGGDRRATYLACVVVLIVFSLLSGVAFEPSMSPLFLLLGLSLGMESARRPQR